MSKITDFYKIPQRLYKYPASERAKEIVKKSITMGTLFSGVWPTQWSNPEAPEIYDKLEHGYSEEDCGKILGGNKMRVFEQVWF